MNKKDNSLSVYEFSAFGSFKVICQGYSSINATEFSPSYIKSIKQGVLHFMMGCGGII